MLSTLLLLVSLLPQSVDAQAADARSVDAQAVDAQAAAPAPKRRIEITLAPGESPRELRAIGIDIVSIARNGSSVRAIVGDHELTLLDASHIDYTIEIEDLQDWYAQRIANDKLASREAPSLGQWLSPPFGQGSMGNYYTFNEVVSVMGQIQSAYSAIVSAPQSIGTSLQGRTLWAFSVSDNPGVSEGEPEVRMDALHHAREPMSMHTMLWYVLYLVENYGSDPLATYLVDHREQWFIPVVNPDGYAYNESTAPGGGGLWRKNRRNNGDGTTGVDLNRNYDYQWGYDNLGSSTSGSSEVYRGASAASEPTVTAMMNFSAAHNFSTALSMHTYSNLWLRPYGYDFVLSPDEAKMSELGDLSTEENFYASVHGVDLYPANGTTIDYDHALHGTYSYTPEIGRDGDGFWPVPSRIVPLAEENLQALIRTALSAGNYFRPTAIQLSDLGDGDGFFEAGETVEIVFTVRNSGRAASGTSVIGSLVTSSPFATADAGTHDFGVIGSFANASNAGSALSLEIDPTANPGDVVSYSLELLADGVVFPMNLEFVVGERYDLVRDDLELDFGWTARDPADTATTGLWVRSDPSATDFNGDPLNPGDDASPGVGTQCFVTGNGRGSSGTDDVDGGFTTLYSPLFNLSGVSVAYVEYSRWWANLSFADDAMLIEVSDDGGTSWIELEEILPTQNFWTPVEFRLSDFVSLTADMQLRFRATDGGTGSLVEAGIDDLKLSIFDSNPRLTVYGTQKINTPVSLNVSGKSGDAYAHIWSPGTGNLPLPGITGNFLLNPLQFFVPFQGSIPSSGIRERVINIPNDATLIGATVYWQSLVTGAGETWLTNRESMTFE